MPHPLLIFSQSDYLFQIVDINLHTEWKTVQIQISWLLQKPTDLDLHCLQRQGISGFSMTRVKNGPYAAPAASTTGAHSIYRQISRISQCWKQYIFTPFGYHMGSSEYWEAIFFCYFCIKYILWVLSEIPLPKLSQWVYKGYILVLK